MSHILRTHLQRLYDFWRSVLCCFCCMYLSPHMGGSYKTSHGSRPYTFDVHSHIKRGYMQQKQPVFSPLYIYISLSPTSKSNIFLKLISQIKQKIQGNPKSHDQIRGGTHCNSWVWKLCSHCRVCSTPNRSWPSIFCNNLDHHHARSTTSRHVHPITRGHVGHQNQICPPSYCGPSLTRSIPNFRSPCVVTCWKTKTQCKTSNHKPHGNRVGLRLRVQLSSTTCWVIRRHVLHFDHWCC